MLSIGKVEIGLWLLSFSGFTTFGIGTMTAPSNSMGNFPWTMKELNKLAIGIGIDTYPGKVWRDLNWMSSFSADLFLSGLRGARSTISVQISSSFKGTLAEGDAEGRFPGFWWSTLGLWLGVTAAVAKWKFRARAASESLSSVPWTVTSLVGNLYLIQSMEWISFYNGFSFLFAEYSAVPASIVQSFYSHHEPVSDRLFVDQSLQGCFARSSSLPTFSFWLRDSS